MKNKFCYIALSLLISFSFMDSVFADDFSFTMSASTNSDEVAVGGQGIITVDLKSSSAVGGCVFNVEADSTLKLESKNGLNNWNFDSSTDGSGKYILENNLNEAVAYPGGKSIFNLIYTVNGSGSVTIKNIECVTAYPDGVNEKGEEVELKAIYSDIKVSFTTEKTSDDTTLSNVVVNGGTLSPSFSSNYQMYTIELDSPNFSLNLTTSNSAYQDKVVVTDSSGNILNASNMTFKDPSGQNLMPFTVTVNDSTVYNFIAHYEEAGLDNSLKSLKVNDQVIGLQSGIFSYSVTLPSDVESIKVEAVLSDSNNFEFDGGGDGNWTYSANDEVITLVIKPKDEQSGGTKMEYTILIEKESGTSTGPTIVLPSISSTSSSNNNITNPQTGNISMFIMAFILISSLIGSIFLYQKNMADYK